MSNKILKNLGAFASLLLLFLVMTACDNESPSLYPDSEPIEGASDRLERAVLVYMLSDNDLGDGSYDRENLADMIRAAKDGRLGNNRLLVYHDDAKAANPKLKEVTPMGLKILKEYDNSQTSISPERMSQVIADFKSFAPANHFGLILWSHATGWLQTGENVLLNGVEPMWVGEDRGKFMNVTTLAQVLNGKGFDYIYFDCCHMASVESLYELRNVADKFVGSCAELPAEGMPYYETLPYLMAIYPDLEGAAHTTYAKYSALSGAECSCTMSVIDASQLSRLAEATRQIYQLHPTLPADYTGQPFERKKRNGEPCYLFDMEHYIEALYSNSSDIRGMRKAYAEWLIAIDDCVTYSATTPWIFYGWYNGFKVDSHCGLTTYILRQESDADTKGYRTLSWYGDVASALFEQTTDEDAETDIE